MEQLTNSFPHGLGPLGTEILEFLVRIFPRWNSATGQMAEFAQPTAKKFLWELHSVFLPAEAAPAQPKG